MAIGLTVRKCNSQNMWSEGGGCPHARTSPKIVDWGDKTFVQVHRVENFSALREIYTSSQHPQRCEGIRLICEGDYIRHSCPQMVSRKWAMKTFVQFSRKLDQRWGYCLSAQKRLHLHSSIETQAYALYADSAVDYNTTGYTSFSLYSLKWGEMRRKYRAGGREDSILVWVPKFWLHFRPTKVTKCHGGDFLPRVTSPPSSM